MAVDYDAIVVSGANNGLVAADYLARPRWAAAILAAAVSAWYMARCR
jgi:hypothetical protein